MHPLYSLFQVIELASFDGVEVAGWPFAASISDGVLIIAEYITRLLKASIDSR
jgi:hypothetical protein